MFYWLRSRDGGFLKGGIWEGGIGEGGCEGIILCLSHLQLHYWTIWQEEKLHHFYRFFPKLVFSWGFPTERNSKVAKGGAGGAQRSILPTSFFLYLWYSGASLGTVLSMLSSGIISSTLGWEAIFYIQVHSRENACVFLFCLHSYLCTQIVELHGGRSL